MLAIWMIAGVVSTAYLGLFFSVQAIIVYFAGIYFNEHLVQLAGIILFAHSSLDRMLGYGLKYEDSFNNTHLGIIGKKQ